MVDKKTQGKKNREAGRRFEKRVRADLEKKGWIVDRWTNQVEWDEDNINRPPEERTGKLVPAKPKFIYNPIIKRRIPIGMSSGFPDFIAFRYGESCDCGHECGHIEGVEAKMNGLLDKEEKEKCRWYISQHIFSKIYIAKKGTKRGQIVYTEFER